MSFATRFAASIPGGIIAVVIYHGGDSGFHERDELIKYFERLDNKRFSVLMHNFINQINYPPILIVIEKNNKNKEKGGIWL